jgi:hypothetical protein
MRTPARLAALGKASGSGCPGLTASLWLAEEQFACGLLEGCRELSVGLAGFAEFAEGLVAGEHEEEVECASGCAVA